MTLFRLYNWSAGQTTDGGFSHRRRQRKLTGDNQKPIDSYKAWLPNCLYQAVPQFLSISVLIKRDQDLMELSALGELHIH
uniref:Uncharacterized protein n=1 Tax=Solanum tuberosum TaxID=4113 RepID=M1BHJ2_SOLTU